MKRAGIAALIAMSVVSVLFIVQTGAAARADELRQHPSTSRADVTGSPVTANDFMVVLVTTLVGVVARPRK